jgi:acetyl-CoA carboxylase beta subunit
MKAKSTRVAWRCKEEARVVLTENSIAERSKIVDEQTHHIHAYANMRRKVIIDNTPVTESQEPSVVAIIARA